jgi:hypothetical protein
MPSQPSAISFMAPSCPVSVFKQRYTLPKLPSPINAPLRHTVEDRAHPVGDDSAIAVSTYKFHALGDLGGGDPATAFPEGAGDTGAGTTTLVPELGLPDSDCGDLLSITRRRKTRGDFLVASLDSEAGACGTAFSDSSALTRRTRPNGLPLWMTKTSPQEGEEALLLLSPRGRTPLSLTGVAQDSSEGVSQRSTVLEIWASKTEAADGARVRWQDKEPDRDDGEPAAGG